MALGTDFDTALTRGALVALALAAVWVVVVVATVALEARSAGRIRLAERTGCPPVVRWWLLGLFVVLLAGVSPAEASDSGSPAGPDQVGAGTIGPALDGLPLPGRAAPPPPAAHRPAHVVVEPGDSLWQIARERLPGATDAELSRAVASTYAANRRSIGPDPDRIRPGQRLVFPSPHTVSEEP